MTKIRIIVCHRSLIRHAELTWERLANPLERVARKGPPPSASGVLRLVCILGVLMLACIFVIFFDCHRSLPFGRAGALHRIVHGLCMLWRARVGAGYAVLDAMPKRGAVPDVSASFEHALKRRSPLSCPFQCDYVICHPGLCVLWRARVGAVCDEQRARQAFRQGHGRPRQQ